MHLFAHSDVVASRIRAYAVPCCSMCKDQTSLMTLQRSYCVNLGIAGGLLNPPRGTDSLSVRCLDTWCFFARQLHVARKPWIIVSSSSSNIWSCPSVLQLATLSHTWPMTLKKVDTVKNASDVTTKYHDEERLGAFMRKGGLRFTRGFESQPHGYTSSWCEPEGRGARDQANADDQC